MAKSLDVRAAATGVRRAADVPRRHQLRRRSRSSNGQFTTDGAKSTIEVLNVLLGQGNDKLTITGTLDPAHRDVRRRSPSPAR